MTPAAAASTAVSSWTRRRWCPTWRRFGTRPSGPPSPTCAAMPGFCPRPRAKTSSGRSSAAARTPRSRRMRAGRCRRRRTLSLTRRRSTRRAGTCRSGRSARSTWRSSWRTAAASSGGCARRWTPGGRRTSRRTRGRPTPWGLTWRGSRTSPCWRCSMGPAARCITSGSTRSPGSGRSRRSLAWPRPTGRACGWTARAWEIPSTRRCAKAAWQSGATSSPIRARSAWLTRWRWRWRTASCA